MPRSLENQVSYSGGEFSPQLDARIDHPKYSQACRQLQNMIALRQGGCTRRPGTQFKAECKFQDNDVHQYATRLMSFQFSPTTSFILEFGHQYVRFYSNQQQVTLSSAPLWDATVGYPKGTFVEDPTDANHIYYCILAVGAGTAPHSDLTHWALQSIYEVPSPYNAQAPYGPSIFSVDVWTVVPCQINDVVYLVHPDYPPYKLTRLGDTNWTMTQVSFLTPALLDQNPTGITIASSAATGATTLTAAATAWANGVYYRVGQSVSNGGLLYTCIVANLSGATFAPDLALGYWQLETIFTAANIGGFFQLKHVRTASYLEQALTAAATSGTIPANGDCEIATYGTWNADLAVQRSDDGGNTWATIITITSRSDHNTSIPLKAPADALFRLVVSNYTSSTAGARAVFTVLSAFVPALVKITAVASAYSATATVVTQLNSLAATVYWSEGAWSTRRGFPRAVTAFQQRLVYGATTFEPQRIWGSVTDDIENFDLGDQSEATDSFAFDLAAVGRGPIQWLIGQVDLFAGFTGAEWIINAGAGAFGGSSDPITPQAINAGEHSSWGSAPGVPPAIVGNAVIYPQRSSKTLQQMMFSVYTNKYQSADLSQLSEHMFGAGIVQLAYQPLFRNQGVIWATTKSGSLCGMTYQLEQQVFAWHRHITGPLPSGHSFESVAVIEGQGTDDDEVWVVVDRGSRYVELVNPSNWETAGQAIKGVPQPVMAEAIYVDSSITVTSPGTSTIGGLDHLIDQAVVGLLNGNKTFGPLTVNGSGEITIPSYTPVFGDILQIGLPMNYAVQAMRLDVDPRAGVLMGITKALSRLYLRLLNSLGGGVNDGGTKTIPIDYRPVTTPLGSGPALYTGDKLVTPVGNQGNDPQFIVQGNDPLPLTLLATVVRYGVEGTA